MNDAMLRLAFAGLSPRAVDGLLDRFQSPSGAARAIEKGKTSHDASIRAAVAVDASVRCMQLDRLGVAWVASGDDAFRRDWLDSRTHRVGCS